MPVESFWNFCCWDSGSVQETLLTNIAHLGLDEDAIFLAAHSEIALTQDRGRNVEKNERGVLDALEGELDRADPARNSLIAVIGPAGSGKSHLVRWVRSQLPIEPDGLARSGKYQVIWIPREVTRTADIIARLLENMRGLDAADEIAERVSVRSEMSRKQLADMVYVAIWSELIHNGIDRENTAWNHLLGEESNGQRSNGLGKLLKSDPLEVRLRETGGIIDELVDSLRVDQEGGDQEPPRFTRDHFPTGDPTVQTALHVLAEADPDLAKPIEIWGLLRSQSSALNDAVDVCNDHLETAMQAVIGLRDDTGGPTLGDAFTEYRQGLRREDKQLVLLFEDLAVFQSVDGWIYDLFRDSPGDDRAPIRAVFAMTDQKYIERVPEGIKTEETFHFGLGTFDLQGGSDDAISFAARWLNVARHGKVQLLEQMDNATVTTRRNNTWFSTYCDQCDHNQECRETFSHVGGIGLYPYNKTALESALKRTEEIESGRGDQLTPRAVMHMLRETLEQSEDELETASFPSDAFEGEDNHFFHWNLRAPEEVIAPRPERLSEEDWRRTLRTRVIWADQSEEPEGIRLAFGLPTLEAPPVELVRCAFCAAELVEADGNLVDADGNTACADNHDGGIHQTIRRDPRIGPTIDNSKPQEIVNWQTNPERTLLAAINDQLREALYAAVKDRVNYGWLLVAPKGARFSTVLDGVLHRNSFNIEKSTGRAHRGLTFELGKSEEVTKLLISALWLDDHKHWRTDEPALFFDDDNFSTWDFPYPDVDRCQVLYENYVSDRAREVEEELRRRLPREASETTNPVDMAIAISTIARRCLGADQFSPDTDARAWDSCAALSVEGSLTSFSEVWEPVAEAARQCLGALRDGLPNYGVDLASAHQGDSPHALVLDAVMTRKLAGEAWVDPVSFLHDLKDPPDDFAPLQNIHTRLCEALTEEVASNEVGLLREVVDQILGYMGETELSDAAPQALAAGNSARDQGVFYPEHKLHDFDQSYQRIEEVAETYSLTALRELRGKLTESQNSAVAVFEFLGHSGKLVQLRNDCKTMSDCLSESLRHVSAQVGGGEMGDDDSDSDPLQAKLAEVETGLENLSESVERVFGANVR